MNQNKLYTFKLFVFALLISSCGPSSQEIKQHEQAVIDSMNAILDSVKSNKTASEALQRSSNSIEEGTKGVLNYSNIKIIYDYDDKLFNKESDIDGKIINESGKSYKNFELMVSCYDSDKTLLKSFKHTINAFVKPGEKERFSIHFKDNKKTKTVKIKLIRAQEA